MKEPFNVSFVVTIEAMHSATLGTRFKIPTFLQKLGIWVYLEFVDTKARPLCFGPEHFDIGY